MAVADPVKFLDFDYYPWGHFFYELVDFACLKRSDEHALSVYIESPRDTPCNDNSYTRICCRCMTCRSNATYRVRLLINKIHSVGAKWPL